MATMSDEQFERFISIMAQQAAGGRGGGGHSGSRRTIFDKGFNRVSKFSHGETAWIDWSFDFKVALGAQSIGMKVALDSVARC